MRFFTTKPGGSGSGNGLVLVRQIFWVQGDSVRISNRTGVGGAVTRVRLPLHTALAS